MLLTLLGQAILPLVVRSALAAVGAGLLAYALNRLWLAGQAKARPTVMGRVRESTVMEVFSRRSKWRYRAQIVYDYQVSGQALTGHRVFYGDELWATRRAEAEEVVNRYPPGTQVTVHYDPAHPERAVLETTVGRRVIGTAIVGVLLVVGAWWLPL